MKIKLILPTLLRGEGASRVINASIQENSPLKNTLINLLGDRFDLIFTPDGECKGYARVFYNDLLLSNLEDISVSDGDEIEIITSMSGG